LRQLTTLDMNSHHTEWVGKLVDVLDIPYDNNQGVSLDARDNRHNNTELIKIEKIINVLKGKFQELSPKLTRCALSVILDDTNLANFLSQPFSSDTITRNCRSQPSLEINKHKLKVRFVFK